MGVIALISLVWAQFKSLDEKIALAAITSFTTVTISKLTVVLGKYYERKKDLEAHYRGKKPKSTMNS